MGYIMGKSGGLTNYFIVCEHNQKKRGTKKETRKKNLMGGSISRSVIISSRKQKIPSAYDHVLVSNNATGK